jgi:hypothetical protein
MHGQEYYASRIIRVSDDIPMVNSSHQGMVVTKEKLVQLRLDTDYPEGTIRYTLDGDDPTEDSPVAKDSISVPLELYSTKHVKVQIFAQDGDRGDIRQIMFIPVQENLARGSTVIANTTIPSKKYAEGNISVLTDGKFGGPSINQDWLGWEGQHADIIIDLGETQTVNRVFTRAVTDVNSWIFLPKTVKVYMSEDGENWSESEELKSKKPTQTYGFDTEDYNIKIDAATARYVRIIAEGILKNPEWHKQPGGKSWVFLDEVIIE